VVIQKSAGGPVMNFLLAYPLTPVYVGVALAICALALVTRIRQEKCNSVPSASAKASSTSRRLARRRAGHVGGRDMKA
jgi:hypothetical protein